MLSFFIVNYIIDNHTRCQCSIREGLISCFWFYLYADTHFTSIFCFINCKCYTKITSTARNVCYAQYATVIKILSIYRETGSLIVIPVPLHLLYNHFVSIIGFRMPISSGWIKVVFSASYRTFFPALAFL